MRSRLFAPIYSRKPSYASYPHSYILGRVSFAFFNSPFTLASYPHYRGQMQFVAIPKNSIFARYAETAPGVFHVVNLSGAILAPSFYDLRHKYTATATVAGSGVWLILTPKTAPARQPALF
jgi:hypothetical protein